MKKMKISRFIAKIMAFSLILSSTSIIPAINASATEEDYPPPLITVIKADGSEIPYEDINTAIANAGQNETVSIGEGTLLLDTALSINKNDITIKGAGMDKTFLKAKDSKIYIDALEENDPNNTWKYYCLVSTIGNNITLSGMTIDGSDITGETGGGACSPSEPIDFVPLRLIGTAYTANPEAVNQKIENIKIVRSNNENDKGSIQIGSNVGDDGISQNRCYATAVNTYVYGNTSGSNYAGVEICDNCKLIIDKGFFNGTINKNNNAELNFTDPNGYYNVESNIGALYTTIPYVVDCYDNISTESSTIEYIINLLATSDVDLEPGVSTIEAMANDLTGAEPQLYGLDCNEKIELAKRFSNALGGCIDKIITDATVKETLNDSKTTVDNALRDDEDWHVWGEDNVCDVCQAERASVEKTSSECVQRSDGADLYGVRFVFKYDAGTIGSEAVDNFGAYVLDTDIFNGETPTEEGLTGKTKLEYNNGQQLKDGETFSVDVIDIPADENATIYAIPFADGVFGDVASQTVPAANTQSIE